MEALLVARRGRLLGAAGIVLLLAGVGLTGAARVPSGGGLDPWESSAASALALGTLLYVPAAIAGIAAMLRDFVSPAAYSDYLSGRRRNGPERRRRLRRDEAYLRLRALRQWLRTASRNGESRDFVFAAL